MDTLTEPIEPEVAPNPELPPSQQPSILDRLRQNPRIRRAATIVGGIGAGCIITVLIVYFQFAAMIDRRLAGGAFSTTIGIYSTPRQVGPGDSITPADLTERLRRAGYSNSPDNPYGWFTANPTGVEIHPGVDSLAHAGPARIEFAQNKIARIRSLPGYGALNDYLLDPQLIANVAENREKRTLVRFNDIPDSLVKAVCAVEDKRFFKHLGFDPFRVMKAAYVDVRDGRKHQGASTLSMQLARNLWLDNDKVWKRKLSEVIITMHLERKLTKQQIFENYANQVYLGRRDTFSIQGFGEASRAFFDKDLSQINTSEAALLAGMIQRPSYYNPVRYPARAKERRDLVLDLMHESGSLTQSEYDQALAAPVRIAKPATDGSSASYFLALVQDELQEKLPEGARPNRYVATTLDADLQQAAEEAVRAGMENVDKQLRRRKGANQAAPQVALIALDPRTGQIRALVGGRNYGASQLNHVLSQRQPGSVFKPFVYAAALTTGADGSAQVFTPATVLNDDETTFYYGRQAYQPGNFHGGFMGPVLMRTALAHSLNVATVSLASQVGYKNVVATARRAGLNDRIKATPSVALGSYETTPLEIAGAYTMFANQGVRVTPTTLAEVRASDSTLLYRHSPDRHAALDPRVNYLMVDLLQEVLRSGTGAGVRGRGFTLPAAGKTGTSRDGWFAGFTSELVCVVWVGFDDNHDLGLEGAKSALPIWADFMKSAAKFRPYRDAKPFAQPAGIVSAEICPESGLRAGPDCAERRWERFLNGTVPAEECAMHSLVGATATASQAAPTQ